MKTANDDDLIAKLAEETAAPVDVVRSLYMRTLRDLASEAAIPDYIRIFAEKRVRTALNVLYSKR